MSETQSETQRETQGETQGETKPLPPPEVPKKRRDIVPWLYGAGFCVLAVGLLWLWQNPAPPPLAPSGRIEALEQRVARLEQRAAPPAVDLRPLESRIAALEQKAPPDTRPLDARLSALEQRPAPAATEPGRILETRLEALERRLATTESLPGQFSALADRAARLARLFAAQAALEDGRPLGEIPGAPPALARFATAAAPTEAALRLSFPAAARAAQKASTPAAAHAPLLERMWMRAQSLVTVRQGDRVIVGDQAAGTIDRARRTLEAGDLAGAVSVLATLQGPAAREFSSWRAQAQALLDARAALADPALVNQAGANPAARP
jgi:hypothetical protein